MSLARFDHLPAEMQAGETEALKAATVDGWIVPPERVAWQPEAPRQWRTAHLRYLHRRGLIGETRYRRDGAWCVRLNSAGLALRDQLLRAAA